MKVEFTKDQYAYLCRVSSRLMAARASLSAKELSQGTNAIVKELATKFSEQVELQETHVVPLKRTHLRFLEGHMEQLLKLIQDKIRPEYLKRGGPDAGEYLQRLDDQEKMLSGALDKIQAAL